MSGAVTIVPAVPSHVAAIVRALREADVREIRCLGVPVRRGVWLSYRLALLRRTALVDGEVAAMWGVGGTPLSRVGRPWMLTTPAVERAVFTFVRKYRSEVQEMLGLFPALENYVDASYEGAIRLLRLGGFTVHEATPMGAAGAPFCRFEARA